MVRQGQPCNKRYYIEPRLAPTSIILQICPWHIVTIRITPLANFPATVVRGTAPAYCTLFAIAFAEDHDEAPIHITNQNTPVRKLVETLQ